MTWSILNKVIKNNKSVKYNYAVGLNINGTGITGSQHLYQQFNKFFSQIGPTLAEKVKLVCWKFQKSYQYLKKEKKWFVQLSPYFSITTSF